jgi:hypothetical protein
MVIKDEGTSRPSEPALNFIGAGVTCVDNAGVSTDCTIPGGGGSGTVTSVACGAGITCAPAPIIATGTVSIGTGAITNAMLASSYSGIGLYKPVCPDAQCQCRSDLCDRRARD